MEFELEINENGSNFSVRGQEISREGNFNITMNFNFLS